MSGGSEKQNEANRHTKVSSEQVKKTLDWISWADKDYIAARRLLLDGLMIQAASLANTALEKYLKAVLAIRGEKIPRIHDPLRLYQGLKPKAPGFQLDEDFLALLVKSYELRYPDELEANFNIVLNQTLILCALDESVSKVMSRFTFKRADGSPVKRILDHLIESKDARIMLKNVILQTITKDELYRQPTRVYEMRVFADNAHMEAEYSAAHVENQSFKRDAFVPKSDREFEHSS